MYALSIKLAAINSLSSFLPYFHLFCSTRNEISVASSSILIFRYSTSLLSLFVCIKSPLISKYEGIMAFTWSHFWEVALVLLLIQSTFLETRGEKYTLASALFFNIKYLWTHWSYIMVWMYGFAWIKEWCFRRLYEPVKFVKLKCVFPKL